MNKKKQGGLGMALEKRIAAAIAKLISLHAGFEVRRALLHTCFDKNGSLVFRREDAELIYDLLDKACEAHMNAKHAELSHTLRGATMTDERQVAVNAEIAIATLFCAVEQAGSRVIRLDAALAEIRHKEAK